MIDKEFAMYGTIFRLKPKAGRESDVVTLMEEWSRSRGQEVKGARAAYLLQSERRPGELVGVAVFDDEESYRANATAPEQDAWYKRLREVLDADPVWEDGTYLFASELRGGNAG
jgi:quinol monooxygenase YgiN